MEIPRDPRTRTADLVLEFPGAFECPQFEN
jgi:hypothetical protein